MPRARELTRSERHGQKDTSRHELRPKKKTRVEASFGIPLDPPVTMASLCSYGRVRVMALASHGLILSAFVPPLWQTTRDELRPSSAANELDSQLSACREVHRKGRSGG